MIASHNPANFANELNKIYAIFDNNDYNNYDAFAMLCKLFFSRSAIFSDRAIFTFPTVAVCQPR